MEGIGRPDVQLCLDTTHLYARGLNCFEPECLDDVLSEFHHTIGLVHLNAPDPQVTLGSFIDRHNTPFQEMKQADPEYLVKTLVSRYPCILERRSLEVQRTDFDYIKGLMETDEPSTVPEAALDTLEE